MIIKQWKKLFFTFFVPSFHMGGGGSPPANTTSTVNQTNVPGWLKPQVQNMIGLAGTQLFNIGKDGQFESIKPYQPYSTHGEDYFADFSPMQKQAFQGAANLTVPGQYDVGSGLATGAGIGALGTAEQGLNAGQQYGSAVTNPYAVQAYMSPYQQAVTDVAKMGALRDFQVGQQYRQGSASKAGAFGGGRQAIENSEAQRNLNQQLQNLDVQGQQSAYNAAMANIGKQAELGMQGLQAAQQGYGLANQAAGTLGTLGGQQFANQQGLINLQNQIGGQQQQRAQDIINADIANYSNAMNYPMQQLQNYNALIRGLGGTTTTYAPPPSMISQIGGLGAAGLGAYLAAKKEGGVIKAYKSGGLVDLAVSNALEGV